MTSIPDLRLVGGRLCLDFLNTADWDGSAIAAEHIGTLADLRAWMGRVGLSRTADPKADANVLERVMAFRQDLRAVFLKVVAGEELDEADAALLNGAFGHCWRANPMVVSHGALAFAHSDEVGPGLQLPVLISAVELLTSPDRQRVKRCPGDRCGWLFVDQSRNGQRRWCSMETCGNREKARAHYARTRG
ncbi:CGNR zinc finger domain-containing protein [Nitratireductor thuwali]|uniref:Zinc finger CGNR domain-containing protein n=1 Tax=Nitratireductor thuwali TaxID=2267699 RepID=A0ABY5MK61_9HYPH|nr:hypothetical protein NTH_02283 [Nitratireductor thuwali]